MSAPDLFTQSVLPLFEVHRASFLERARAAAFQIATKQGTLTIDDVREVVPLPKDMDGRVFGAVLKRDFELVGYRKSSRRACHNRPVGIFKLRERA